MNKKFLICLIVFLVSLNVYSASKNCNDAAERFINREWNINPVWKKQTHRGYFESHISATARIGQWLEKRVIDDGEIVLVKVTPESTETSRFS